VDDHDTTFDTYLGRSPGSPLWTVSWSPDCRSHSDADGGAGRWQGYECLRHIGEVWTDLRLLSVGRQMAGWGARATAPWPPTGAGRWPLPLSAT